MNYQSKIHDGISLATAPLLQERLQKAQPTIAGLPALNVEEIKAEVTLGIPTKRCAGTGICRLVILGENRPVTEHCRCKQAIAMISVTPYKGLKFRFLKESMCSNAARKHFNNQFAMRESITLPIELVERFDLVYSHLAKGVYPVIESEHDLTVYF